MKRSPINKVGARTKKRRAMNLRLKRRHQDLCLPEECEVKLEGCLITWALTWAHSKKSRFLQSDEDWLEAALCCVSCHDKIEAMSHEKMAMYVLQAIAKRGESQ